MHCVLALKIGGAERTTGSLLLQCRWLTCSTCSTCSLLLLAYRVGAGRQGLQHDLALKREDADARRVHIQHQCPPDIFTRALLLAYGLTMSFQKQRQMHQMRFHILPMTAEHT